MAAKIIEKTPSKDKFKVISVARSLSRAATWLSPADQLASQSGSEFGRHIREQVKNLGKTGDGTLALSVQSKTQAVVMTLKRYNQLLEIMANYKAMIELQSEQIVDDAQTYFDQAFEEMNTEVSVAAIDSLFSAKSEDLACTYRPGTTETNL